MDSVQPALFAHPDRPSGRPSPVATARAAARLHLHGRGVAEIDLLDRAELATCEIVANTVRHGDGRSTWN